MTIRVDHDTAKRISVLNYYNSYLCFETRSLLSGHPAAATKYLIGMQFFIVLKTNYGNVVVQRCRRGCRFGCVSLDCSLAIFAGAICLGADSRAIAQTPAGAPTVAMPEIVVSAPKTKPKPKRAARRPAPAAPVGVANAGPAPAPAETVAGGTGGTLTGLQTVPGLGKTGTPLADLPQSVVVVPRSLVVEQGGTTLI
jgi:hypothetical protein